MKSYPVYKNLDLDFLDAIPEHWGLAKLKYLSSVSFSSVDKHSFEDEIPVRLCNYVDVYKNDLISSDMPFMQATATQVEVDRYTLRKGDVLITKDSESWDDIAVPAYVRENIDGVVCGYHLAQIRPSAIDSKYLFWVFCSSTLNDQYKVEAHGITRYGLGKDSIENSLIPIPLLLEQQAIADYLDCKTAQIDTLIKKKLRQIELLQEQRTALINHTVTKGLNPNSPMKDSGVDWLGDIPSHWETWKLQHLCSTTKGVAFKSDIFTDEGVYVVKATNIKNESIVNVNTFMSIDDAKAFPSVELREGDIILSTVGSKPHIIDSAVGQIARIPKMYEGALLNQNTVRIENQRTDYVTTNYLFLALRSHRFKKHLGLHAHGTANQASINLEDILSFFITLPPIEEQQIIVNYIEKQFRSIGKSVTDIQKEINLLDEYRTALISEAVTGKIDVREWRKAIHE